MVNILKKRIFRKRGTSDAAPRSRHQKKALCFQTEYPRRSTPPGCRSAGSLLGFWRRPLQRGLRHLQVWRVITSWVSSPYIPMLNIHFFAIIVSVKNHPASYDSLTLFRLLSRELLLVVCRQPYVFSVHRKTMSFFSEWIWNTEMWRSLRQTKLTATEVIVRSQQSFLVVTVSDCCWSTFPPSFFFFVSLYSTFNERCRAVGPLGSDPRRPGGTVEWRLRCPPR